MNQVTLIGNLTHDPELKTSKEGGRSYTQFTLAVDNHKGKEKQTDFLDVVAFGQKADILTSHMTKGRKLFVAGRLQNNKFVGEDGTKWYTTKVILEDFEFVDKKRA